MLPSPSSLAIGRAGLPSERSREEEHGEQHIHIYLSLYTYIYIYIHTYLSICLSLSLSLSLSLYIYIYIKPQILKMRILPLRTAGWSLKASALVSISVRHERFEPLVGKEC